MRTGARKMVAGEGEVKTGTRLATANPARITVPEKLIFPGAGDDGGMLAIEPGETITVSDTEWQRIKGKTDGDGRKLVVEG